MASHCFVCQLPILSHQTWDTWTCGPGIGPSQSILTDIFHEDCLHCSVCMIRLKQVMHLIIVKKSLKKMSLSIG